MSKVQRQNGGLSPGGVGSEVLPGPEELKPSHTQMLNAELAPLATREVMSLIGATRANEQLRLNVPPEVRQDFFTLRGLIARFRRDLQSEELVAALEEVPEGISEEAANFMRASLVREDSMLALVEDVLKDAGRIYNRIVSSQEG